MSKPEARERLLSLEAVAFKEHSQAPSATKLADTRKALLDHIEEIASSGKGEWIIAMERDLIANDLARYAREDDTPMTSSLNAALQGLAAIERKHRIVDEPASYRRVKEEFSFPKNRKHGLPLDEARQAFGSHRARLGNLAKSRLETTEKQIIHARRTALGAAEREYIKRQARTLGVEPAGV